MTNFGLTELQSAIIIEELSRFPEIDKVILFGSRAMGNYKPASDVDLLISGTGINAAIASRIYGRLNEEVALPFKIDLVFARDDIPAAFREHIDRHGVLFFTRT